MESRSTGAPDIWAFGCVVYELLTGRPAFDGPTDSDTLAVILKGEPDWTALPSMIPPRVRELLRRCLAKDSKFRLRDIGDARPELESPDPMQASSTVPVATPRKRERAWMVVAGLATLTAIGLLGSRYLATAPAPEPVSFTVSPPENYAFPSSQGFFAISPDGRHLAFVATADGESRLWVRSLDSVTPRLLAGTEGAVQPSGQPTADPWYSRTRSAD